MNLFHLLYECKQVLGIELGIAHINHGQREESVIEEEYLRQLAEESNVPFICPILKVFFRRSGAKMALWIFATIMEKEGYTALVTAHHADDQAETVFMRLIRGGRLRHLSAIQPTQPFATGELIRPLLSFKRQILKSYFILKILAM